MVIEGPFKSIGDDVFQVVGADGEIVQGKAVFFADTGVGDEPVIGAEGNREFLFKHTAEGVIRQGFQVRGGLHIAGETDFDGDASVGDVVDQFGHIGFRVLFMGAVDKVCIKEVEPMTDPVRLQFCNRLKDAFGTKGFARVDRFMEKALFDQFIACLMVAGGVSVLSAGEIKTDNLD